MRSVLTRSFARHYVEMVLVMLVGMGVLALPARAASARVVDDVDDPTLMLARMAVIMTVPMVPWMRWRGHAWRPCLEMVGAMVVPALAVIALLEAGTITSVGTLMMLEHTAMFAAMFLVMAARPEEYSHARGDTAVAAG